MENTFKSLLNFMQQNDKNGEWLTADETEVDYILETLNEWIQDGLPTTKRVLSYVDYLKEQSFMRDYYGNDN